MTTRQAHSASESHRRTVRRYWRRKERPVGWWPWGLLLPLALLLLWAYGATRTANQIQSQVGAQVSEALGASGYTSTELRVDGQRVEVDLVAEKAEEARAHETAAATECDTWAGKLVCPSAIALNVLEPPRFHDFQFSQADTAIVLTGDVPSEAERERLEREAAVHFAAVDNQLQVTDKTPTEQWLPATARALSVLPVLNEGKASWKEGVFSVTGRVDASDEARARELIDAPADAMVLGESQLEVVAGGEHHDFAFNRDESGIVLTGDVPSEAERERLEREAAAHFVAVDNQLQVTDKTPTEQWLPATARALNVLPVLNEGKASWKEGVFSVTGRVDANGEARARELIDAPADAMVLGESQLEVVAGSEYHNFAFRSGEAGIVLTGDVPSEVERERLEREAAVHFAAVDNQLQVTDKTPTDQWPVATERAMRVLPLLQEGTTTWQDGVFSTAGLVQAAKEASARELIDAPAGEMMLGESQLEVVMAPEHHNFAFTYADAGVVLNGVVPSEAERERIEREAANHFTTVDNQLQVTGKTSTEQWPAATEHAMRVLPLLNEGTATWQDGVFSVTGEVDGENEALTREHFSTPVGAVALGEAELVVATKPLHHSFKFSLDESGMELTGEAPTLEERERLRAEAAKHDSRVTNSLRVSGKEATPEWTIATERAIALLPLFNEGTAQWKDGVFSADATLDAENEAPAREQLTSLSEELTVGEVSLKVSSTPQYHDFGFISDGSTIVLEGDVPTAEHRELILATAAERFATVEDELVVTNQVATAQWSVAAERAMRVLPLLESGTAHWKGGVFSIDGVVSNTNETTAREQFRMPVDTITLGDASLEVLQSVVTCKKQMSDALQSTTMNFATGTAIIEQKSLVLLERLAALAGMCPGQLTIEGHTDNVGNPKDNKELSMERARAVRSALAGLGVDVSRLTALGFGADRPIASNDTAEGRARNRRIAITFADDAATE